MNYFNFRDFLQALIVAILGPLFIFIFKKIFELVKFKKFKSMIDKEYFDFLYSNLEKKDLENLRLEIENKTKRLSHILEKEIAFFKFYNNIKYVRLIDYFLVTYKEILKEIKSYGFRNVDYDKSVIDKEKILNINKILEKHKKNIDNYINLKSDKLVSDL
ncbi:MAG: hypothetical protein E7G18_05765 [Anaerococcus hydrogenalis]|uniref:hypothetical protein n=1 Tax=Anaerococcus hydrogenalis TaxID=33029 RepID=UPI002914D208|nr:hypothetical protein [Anaerococcus hydrogenalis]MDU3688175.1 hypothetical protein [Anaerococcus hydrogenalis]